MMTTRAGPEPTSSCPIGSWTSAASRELIGLVPRDREPPCDVARELRRLGHREGTERVLRANVGRCSAHVPFGELTQIVFASKIRDEDLRDQAQRAARSVFLQLCEGLPNDRIAMRRNYFTRARDSLLATAA
jgi:hypothetical protein